MRRRIGNAPYAGVTVRPKPFIDALAAGIMEGGHELAATLQHPAHCARPGELGTPAPASHLLALALAAIRQRDDRLQHFRPELFGDPAWDMLLDLFVARLRGELVCISSLCIAAKVPPTTALRWIGNMEAHGEILRRPDPTDRRRIHAFISDGAFEAVARILARSEL